MPQPLPDVQYAVQLVGPDQLVLNQAKPVPAPGPHQIVCEVEAVGLCFSDLKLLKQFAAHPRKGRIVAGIDPHVLDDVPSYVPGLKPTVPGHEAVVRVRAVGPQVSRYHPGQRFLVQTDYRWLATEGASNAAFGYNIEGALQQYVLMDERIITSPEGESLLIPVGEDLSASAVALVEPWACVEDAYVSPERTGLKAGGRLLIVLDPGRDAAPIPSLLAAMPRPAEIIYVGAPNPDGPSHASLAALQGQHFDDILYLGSDAAVLERAAAMLDAHGLLCLVLGGFRLSRQVRLPIGRVHYGGIRIIATADNDPLQAYHRIPATGEIRPHDRLHVVGAGGPMGTMHVIRNLCQGVPHVTVVASDVDDRRLAELRAKAQPLAAAAGLDLVTFNPARAPRHEEYSYVALMAPVPALVAAAVQSAAPHAILNLFAGIPADQTADIDMNRYADRHLYMIGTSGSVIRDMKIVLEKMTAGRLDTNASVAAVAGMRGALAGLKAVEHRTLGGKIVVYPRLRELDLVPLEALQERFPSVHARLADGAWTREAEQELLRVAAAAG